MLSFSRWVYFTYASLKEPIESAYKGEARSKISWKVNNITSKAHQSDFLLTTEPVINSSRLLIGAWGNIRPVLMPCGQHQCAAVFK